MIYKKKKEKEKRPQKNDLFIFLYIKKMGLKHRLMHTQHLAPLI